MQLLSGEAAALFCKQHAITGSSSYFVGIAAALRIQFLCLHANQCRRYGGTFHSQAEAFLYCFQWRRHFCIIQRRERKVNTADPHHTCTPHRQREPHKSHSQDYFLLFTACSLDKGSVLPALAMKSLLLESASKHTPPHASGLPCLCLVTTGECCVLCSVRASSWIRIQPRSWKGLG